MKTQIQISLTVASIVAWSLPVSADYTLVLKNGRAITVRSYREEGKMIKFYGIGGEIGLSRDQIQAIRKTGDGERQDFSLPAPAVASSRSFGDSHPSSDTPPMESRESAGPEQTQRENAANEELEQQKRLQEITEQLDTAKQRYVNATQGGGTGANLSKEGINAWVADLGSRIKDAQKSPLSEYTPKMRELSQLRSQIDKLQKERDGLVQEMKARNSAARSQ